MGPPVELRQPALKPDDGERGEVSFVEALAVYVFETTD